MDSVDLEKLYSPSQWSLRQDATLAEQKYFEITREGSQKTVKNVPGRLDASYGDTENQKIDFFGEDLPKDAPIFVFLHGGYWVCGCSQDSRYFVPPFYKVGILCCIVGYDLISESILLPDIVAEVWKAFSFILDYASKRGSKGVYICGHSAGAHLITMALSSSSVQLKNIELIKGVIPMCGLFELKALLPTSYAPAARITKEIAETCSPLTAVDQLKMTLSSSASVFVIAAQHDTPAFVKQSLEYYQAIKKAGIKCHYDLIKGEDHYSVVEKLPSPEFTLTKKLIDIVAS